MLSERDHTRLSARLCPYRETARRALETADHVIWATSLAITHATQDRLSHTLVGGTAGFEVRRVPEGLSIATDALGTCPLWYARCGDGWAVSPEAKALAAVVPVELRPDEPLRAAGPRAADWSPFTNVSRVPPGCSLTLANGRLLIEGRPLRFDPPRSAEPDRTDWPERLGRTLIDSFVQVVPSNHAIQASDSSTANEPTGAFISGGIDSSIACALARRGGPVASYSLGTRFGDEFEAARNLADGLGCTHREVQFDASMVEQELERVVFQNEVFDGLTAEILVQLSVLYAAAAPSCRRIVTGYGSDLLFDGMLRHAGYMGAVGLTSTAELIERTRWTGELAPFLHWSRGIAAHHVFWTPSVIDVALSVPRELCYVAGVEKHVLREAATRAGLLSRSLAFRGKVGLSDGTGANRLLSNTLGITATYGYDEKSRHCRERLRRLIGG